VDEAAPIDAVPRWFEGVRLNFAENVLFSRPSSSSSPGEQGTQFKADGRVAVTEIREGGSDTRHVSWGELRQKAGRLAAAMAAAGVAKGDRVVVVGANGVDTLVVWLATGWLGAVFSSSSTDMGVQGILQRTVQVNPKVRPSPPFTGNDDGMVDADNNSFSVMDSCSSWTTQPSTMVRRWTCGRSWPT
jgi:acetoacetyl-CoA synthetase